MCIGTGLTFFLGLSLAHPRWRKVCFAQSTLCVRGVLASLALAGGLVAVVAGALLFSGEKRGGNDDPPTGSLRKGARCPKAPRTARPRTD